MYNSDIFVAKSPLGYDVTCTVHQWNTHILPGHSELEHREDDVKSTIETPLKVYQSGIHTDRHIYFSYPNVKDGKNRYTKVVIGPTTLKTVYSVITAFDVKQVRKPDDKGVILYDADQKS